MLVTESDARRQVCAVTTTSNCQGRHCMAWRELADGRGWCGRAQIPPEAVAESVNEMVKNLSPMIRVMTGLRGLDS